MRLLEYLRLFSVLCENEGRNPWERLQWYRMVMPFQFNNTVCPSYMTLFLVRLILFYNIRQIMTQAILPQYSTLSSLYLSSQPSTKMSDISKTTYDLFLNFYHCLQNLLKSILVTQSWNLAPLYIWRFLLFPILQTREKS